MGFLWKFRQPERSQVRRANALDLKNCAHLLAQLLAIHHAPSKARRRRLYNHFFSCNLERSIRARQRGNAQSKDP